MHTQKHANHMISSWLETLTDYDFEVIHKPGIKNILPDRLSRLYPDEGTDGAKEIKIWAIAPIETFQGPTVDSELTPHTKETLMARAHQEGHFEALAMQKKLLFAGHKWPNMLEDLQRLTKSCVTCQRYNIQKHGFHPMQSIDSDLPFDHVAIDLKEGLGFCTRFVFLKALKDKTMYSVAEKLMDVFSIMGFPRIVQSDNGSEFVNDVVKTMTEIMSVEHRLITPYKPRANGAAERWVGSTTQTLLKTLQCKKTRWCR